MNILIIGSGAREHAIAKALARSLKKHKLFCFASSNNPGLQELTVDYWIGNICDVDTVASIAAKRKIDLAIIGPEAPLEQGLADALWARAIPVIGPRKKLSQIETSKAFTRELLKKYNIPGSPEYHVFNNLIGVKEFLEKLGEDNYVIKADGLMGGKGVKVAGDHLHTIREAYQYCQELHAKNMMFVIEEKLIGQEFSFMSFCDGEHLIPMPLIQDHKRAYVNDEGPNTGGMGSYSDADHSLPFVTKEEIIAAQNINEAVMRALMTECGEKYIGILYGSFMLTKSGVRLIEYNARFGDPEALNALAILESDLIDIYLAMIAGNLSQDHVKFSNLATVCKYAVPEGYPDAPSKDIPIDVSEIKQPKQLYLGAVDMRQGKLFATGSRTAAVVGVGKTIQEAEKMAEEEIKRIQGALFHREDIGTQELIQRRINQMVELRGCAI
jgi:phosphoribosylamine--glycine ligase